MQGGSRRDGQDVPEIVPLRRFHLKDVVLTGALALAAYLIISPPTLTGR